MKNFKWIFALHSIGAILSMCAIGVAVGMKSLPLAVIGFILLILIMGNGFKTKKRMREQGTL